MTQERINQLREQMMEDLRNRAIENFAVFLGHSPDTATPDKLRAYLLHMADTEVASPVCNRRITALRLFLSMIYAYSEMQKYMQFRTEPR